MQILNCFLIFPGMPKTIDPSGTIIFSVIRAFAPIIQFFPILAPFSGEFFTFSGIDWIIFQVIAAAVILTASVIVKKKYGRYNYKQKFYSF